MEIVAAVGVIIIGLVVARFRRRASASVTVEAAPVTVIASGRRAAFAPGRRRR